MSFLPSIKKNKKTYIALVSIITLIVGYNEATPFLDKMESLSYTGWLIFLATFVLIMNLAIRLKI